MLPIRAEHRKNTSMTIAPKEISPAAIKASAAEKITPMMQQYLR
jgi:hypothetical protein